MIGDLYKRGFFFFFFDTSVFSVTRRWPWKFDLSSLFFMKEISQWNRNQGIKFMTFKFQVNYVLLSLNLKWYYELEKKRDTLRGSKFVWCWWFSEGLCPLPSLGISQEEEDRLPTWLGASSNKEDNTSISPLSPGSPQTCRCFTEWLWHSNSRGERDDCVESREERGEAVPLSFL